MLGRAKSVSRLASLLVALTFVFASANAQTVDITQYTFSTGVGTSSDWLAPSTTYSSLVTGDDNASSVSNLGFTFTFEGTQYTQFSVSTNGQLRLGSTAISGSYYSTPFSSSYVAYNYPKIIGIGADLYGSTLSYGVSGSAPNRIGVFTYYGYFLSNSYYFYFKVYLYEATGEIKIMYYNPPTSVYSCQIGIEGANTANVVTVNPSTHTTSLGATSTTYTTWPGLYRYYSFMPPNLSCPGVANLAVNGTTLSWTEQGSATQWIVEYGPLGFTPGAGTRVMVSGTPSYSFSSLSGGMYSFYVRSYCGVGDTSRRFGPVSVAHNYNF